MMKTRFSSSNQPFLEESDIRSSSTPYSIFAGMDNPEKVASVSISFGIRMKLNWSAWDP